MGCIWRTDGILLAVRDRSWWMTLSWAALCFGLFVLLEVLVANDWGPLHDLDHQGDPVQAWSVDAGWGRDVLRVMEETFSTVPMLVYTALIAVALFVRNQRRAAYYTAGVMLATYAATRLTKELVDRDRPAWQDPGSSITGLSFPSGHAAYSAALAGIGAVLVLTFVRRASARQLLVVLFALFAISISLDRLLLGRHYPTDVIGGALLGLGFVILGVALYSPVPRGHAEKAEPLPEVYFSERKLAVVLNPIKVEDEDQFKAIVSAMAKEAGWSEPSWFHTTIEDPGTGMAEAAAVGGADLVLVCGGDGTVREVCAELAGTGIPVGIVPAGTGNLLARNLEIPLYLRSAIDVALNGQDQAVDLVAVTGDGIEDSHFMVMAGMGFDAAIMEGVNEEIKKKVGWLAYFLSGARSIMFPAVKVEVSVDGAPYTKHRARTVVVGNVGFLQAGMPLLPDARIDDGLLDVVLLHPRRFINWLPIVWRVLARRPQTDETLDRMTGRTVSIRAASDTPRQLDGDSIGPGRELHMECIHGRLLVRVPR
jgi:YegS/Rv2252/BmrU family lipid kinase